MYRDDKGARFMNAMCMSRRTVVLYLNWELAVAAMCHRCRDRETTQGPIHTLPVSQCLEAAVIG